MNFAFDVKFGVGVLVGILIVWLLLAGKRSKSQGS